MLVEFLPGFSQLWQTLTDDTSGRLQSAYPTAADRALEVLAGDFDLVSTVGADAAKAAGVRLPKRDRATLEEGLVFATTYRGVEDLMRAGAMRVPRPLWELIPDFWYVALHTQIEAFEELLRKIAALGAPEDADAWQDLLSRAQVWCKERKDSLSKGRGTVAHPNTYFARAVDEEGHWEPALLLGTVGLISLQSMFKPERRERFLRRVGDWALVWSHASKEMDGARGEAAGLMRRAR